MSIFSDKAIAIAGSNDIPAITLLLNSAYRGETSTHGWTTEAHLIGGNVRTDEAHLQETMEKPGSVMLKYTDEAGHIIGCVNLQKDGQKVYLGMLSVKPLLQGGGVGKKLLRAAEDFAIQHHCTAIYMTVISVRKELIDWYKRHGYVETGERIPFSEDGLTGNHLHELEFMLLEKQLDNTQAEVS